MAVVRCPRCRGASRVASDALGHRVACPRCPATFVAAEEPQERPARASDPPQPAAPTGPRPAAVIPIAPPRARGGALAALAPDPPPASAEPDAPPAIPDPEHDPHLPPPAGLPVSVLVGLALIPFGIPLLWFAAPFVTGQEPALSLAVPISLAFAASALCLGVVYTIDWTAATRVKGVLMLVGLAYLSAAGLYFLKKDVVDRVQRLGGDPNRWAYVPLDKGRCYVQMPGDAWRLQLDGHPLDGLAKVEEGREARFVPTDDGPRYTYQAAVGELPAAQKPDDAWFDRVGQKLANGGPPGQVTPIRYQGRADAPGRQWTFDPGNNTGPVRIVRVYAIKGRVYYLSAEGPNLTPEDEHADPFFRPFTVK